MVKQWLLSDSFKCAANSLSAGAPPCTPLGNYATLHHSLVSGEGLRSPHFPPLEAFGISVSTHPLPVSKIPGYGTAWRRRVYCTSKYAKICGGNKPYWHLSKSAYRPHSWFTCK